MINARRMAVVLEVEVSELFNCRGSDPSGCSQDTVDRGLDDLYRRGVRSSLLLNKFDNPLSGVRFDSGPIGVLINAANRNSYGSFLGRPGPARGPERDNTIETGAPPASSFLGGLLGQLGVPAPTSGASRPRVPRRRRGRPAESPTRSSRSTGGRRSTASAPASASSTTRRKASPTTASTPSGTRRSGRPEARNSLTTCFEAPRLTCRCGNARLAFPPVAARAPPAASPGAGSGPCASAWARGSSWGAGPAPAARTRLELLRAGQARHERRPNRRDDEEGEGRPGGQQRPRPAGAWDRTRHLRQAPAARQADRGRSMDRAPRHEDDCLRGPGRRRSHRGGGRSQSGAQPWFASRLPAACPAQGSDPPAADRRQPRIDQDRPRASGAADRSARRSSVPVRLRSVANSGRAEIVGPSGRKPATRGRPSGRPRRHAGRSGSHPPCGCGRRPRCRCRPSGSARSTGGGPRRSG